MTADPDTIFALSSGRGRAAIAVVRLSGPGAGEALRRLLGSAPPPPRRASLRRLRTAEGRELDDALVIWMPGPASFTGEDQAELHIHGGAAARAALVGELGRIAGCRPAEPGEFTRRAFLSGKLDLSAVEGLADLIDAETEAQRRQALSQLRGALSERVEAWRDRLLNAAALLEAGLDFADEDYVPITLPPRFPDELSEVGQEVAEALAGAARGERVREGYLVVIAGPPNAGKSTLLNAIARREAAIVSPVPGTTRDAIEVRCDLEGWPVTLVDTAGLRETADPTEQEGVRRTRRRLEEADLVLWLWPGEGAAGPAPTGARSLSIRTKADLAPPVPQASEGGPAARLAISALTGAGMEALLARIVAELGAWPGGDGESALVTRERHRLALEEVRLCLARAGAALHNDQVELAAEDVRLALRALGRIVGAVDVEDVLDRVFAQFCIGK